MITPAIQALLQRADLGERVAGNERNRWFWKGYAQGLKDLARGTGNTLAAKDAALLQQPQTGDQRARAALPADLKRLTTVEVVEHFRAQGIEISHDAAADIDVLAGQQFPHAVLTGAVAAHDEHAAPVVDVGDGARLHGASVVHGGPAC